MFEDRSDIPDPYLIGAPDWVIGVLSPANSVTEMNQKFDVRIKNGCSCFWIVDPKRRTVSAIEWENDRVSFRMRRFSAADSIPLPSPLEGAISVASIFEG